LLVGRTAEIDKKGHESLNSDAQPVVVPAADLSEDALLQLAYERLMRERGNDQPGDEISDSMIEKVLRAIRRGDILITFDPHSESVGLLDAKEFHRRERAAQK
jgi:uncharacterized protein YheU (UPF0270 family)